MDFTVHSLLTLLKSNAQIVKIKMADETNSSSGYAPSQYTSSPDTARYTPGRYTPSPDTARYTPVSLYTSNSSSPVAARLVPVSEVQHRSRRYASFICGGGRVSDDDTGDTSSHTSSQRHHLRHRHVIVTARPPNNNNAL